MTPQQPGTPPPRDPMSLMISGSEESLLARIDEKRNTDHNGTLSLYCALVDEDINLFEMFRKTKGATEMNKFTWNDVIPTRMIDRRVRDFVFKTRPTKIDKKDMGNDFEKDSIYSGIQL
eukprot:4512950-Karenia_brevis.AAC.1